MARAEAGVHGCGLAARPAVRAARAARAGSEPGTIRAQAATNQLAGGVLDRRREPLDESELVQQRMAEERVTPVQDHVAAGSTGHVPGVEVTVYEGVRHATVGDGRHPGREARHQRLQRAALRPLERGHPTARPPQRSAATTWPGVGPAPPARSARPVDPGPGCWRPVSSSTIGRSASGSRTRGWSGPAMSTSSARPEAKSISRGATGSTDPVDHRALVREEVGHRLEPDRGRPRVGIRHSADRFQVRICWARPVRSSPAIARAARPPRPAAPPDRRAAPRSAAAVGRPADRPASSAKSRRRGPVGLGEVGDLPTGRSDRRRCAAAGAR